MKMVRVILKGFMALGLFTNMVLNAQHLKVEKLSCEYMQNPLGIDIEHPILGWTLASVQKNQSQSAYEILVSDDLNVINKFRGNRWSTGKVFSSQSSNIIYKGKPLQSFKRYYWRVKAYDAAGSPTTWSPVGWFETAMLFDNDWKAFWISDGKPFPANDEDSYREDPMPVFRKAFRAHKKIESARLYISGLGYYEAFLNAAKIGDHVLDPGWTPYSKHVSYAVYDVSKELKQGNNYLSVMLGNGWYNPLPLRFWGSINLRNALTIGRPCLKAQLMIRYSDGSANCIVTDSSWETAPGPVLKNSVYLGEQYDARLENQDWMKGSTSQINSGKAVITTGPGGKLISQLQPPIKATKIIKPISITEVSQGKFLVDMGQNFAGVARIKLTAPAGTRVVLRYGEDKLKDGNINLMTGVAGQIKNGNGGPGAPKIAWQEDSYVCKGQEIETWSPMFTFHVFRFIEITGWPGKPTPANIEGLRMNSDVEDAGTFECSNEMFNQLQQNLVWTFKSNIFSVQSDCPGREKFGYGGDLFCTTEAFLYNFSMNNFYRKALQDFEDEQRPRGGFTETAPYVGIADKGPGDQSGPLGWQLGFGYLMKQLYDFYGDKRIIEKHYASFKKQVDYLVSKAKNNLFDDDISDHESLDVKPVALTASAFYYHHLKLLATFSGILNKKEDSENYENLAGRVKQAIRQKFYKGNGIFGQPTQASQIFGLWYDLVPEDQAQVLSTLKDEFIKKDNHLSTGIFATKMMFDVMRRMEGIDLMYEVANQKSFPGWGYMIQNGATTLWETWAYSDNVFSQNHPMFGSIGEWFYRSLLGINAKTPGFKEIIIKPQIPKGLFFAKGSYLTPYGKVASDWKLTDGTVKLQVEIPVNTTAEVWVPKLSDNDSKPLLGQEGVKFLKFEKNYLVYTVGSGKYSF